MFIPQHHYVWLEITFEKGQPGSETIPSGHFEIQDKQRGLKARMLSLFREEGERWTLDILHYEDI